MGMFDYIHCDYELPGKPPYGPEGCMGGYQTKDLDCTLDTYIITEDGRLRQRTPIDYGEGLRKTKELSDFTGEINFYTSNICASGPGIYTSNGDDAISVEYVAKFVNGKVIEITEMACEISPALPSKTNLVYRDYDDSYIEMPENPTKLYVFYGGQEKGYYGDVVAIGDTHTGGKQEICLKVIGDQDYKKNGELEVVQKWQWGSTLFLTEEDGFAHKNRRKDSWNKYKKIYDDYSAEWHKKREQK
jgi:hypothetical protein